MRLIIATLIAVAIWIDSHAYWVLLWLAAVFVSQCVDYAMTRIVWGRPRARKILLLRAYVAQLFVTSGVYSSMVYLISIHGGLQQVVLATTVALGSMLHATLNMRHVRPAFLASLIPHIGWYLSMAMAAHLNPDVAGGVLILLGGGLYVSHLLVGARNSGRTEVALVHALRMSHRDRYRAERASSAKSDFLAVVSHEIRTPMNAVISSAHLLERVIEDPEQRRHVLVLRDASRALLGLLNDLLDFSKIEAGKMKLDTHPVDVAEELRACGRLWRERAEEKGLELAVEIDPATPGAVRLDPLRFQQILSNLLSNAIKFTEHGRVALRMEWAAGARRLHIEVSDTGCGIPPERIESIFMSFEQAQADISRLYGGTGLGLSISRALVALMGGALTVRSAPDQGSTFHLELPVEPVESGAFAAASSEAAPTGALKGRRILAADDNELNRVVLKSLIEPLGCVLTLVENGALALEAARRARFDLILLDMQMPVMNGLEAAHAIREDSLNADAPIIALTANALDSHRAQWAAVRVAGYLTKPIDPASLGAYLAGKVLTRAAP